MKSRFIHVLASYKRVSKLIRRLWKVEVIRSCLSAFLCHASNSIQLLKKIRNICVNLLSRFVPCDITIGLIVSLRAKVRCNYLSHCADITVAYMAVRTTAIQRPVKLCFWQQWRVTSIHPLNADRDLALPTEQACCHSDYCITSSEMAAMQLPIKRRALHIYRSDFNFLSKHVCRRLWREFSAAIVLLTVDKYTRYETRSVIVYSVHNRAQCT